MPVRRRATVVFLTLALLLQARPALAYIDPGTGSALFYVVSGIVVSLYFGIRGLSYRLLHFAFGMRRRDPRCELAIHCEDPRYEIIFLPLAKALLKRGIEPTLFTMYERDGSLEPLPTGVTHRPIPSGMVGYAYLNNLDATVLLTTTPQLDVMTFRRSKRVKHYAMIQHALGESRYMRPFAYDYYDSVLCCGPLLKANIRRMESIRATPAKELYETGLPHYEELQKRVGQAPAPGSAPTVLIAPSWGPLSMFESFGVEFVAEIARHYRVIVRPHPQMRISQAQLYARILALEGVEVDTERTPSGAMSKAHVLLSDISGITHEFAFIHERPVLIVDRQQKTGGLEGELLGGDSELKQLCSEFIVSIPPSEMPNVVQHLADTLKKHSAMRLRQKRSELVYNFGRASEVAADQLATILNRTKANA